MTNTSFQEKRKVFAKRSAKVWQNFFETKGILPDISLSKEQIAVVQQEEPQMMISGSAGSGKSLTLLYKLIKVIEQESEPKRILYCSFNSTLIEDAQKRRDRSARYHELKVRHTIHFNTFHYMAARLLQEIGLYKTAIMKTDLNNIHRLEDRMKHRTIILIDQFKGSKEEQALPKTQALFDTHDGGFLLDEIMWMKANGYTELNRYLNCERTGRGGNPRLTKEQRKTIFHLYEQYHNRRKEHYHDELDFEDFALLLLKHMDEIPESLKYDYIYVDEMQDLQPMQLKALALLCKKSLVLCGDAKQRIYKRSPHSYKTLGIEIEGRKNRKLKTNFRSTKQIMSMASQIQFMDTENDREDDQDFVREGPKPQVRYYQNDQTLSRFIINEIKNIRLKDDKASIAVIHRHDQDANKENKCYVKKALNSEFDVVTVRKYAKRYDLDQTKKPIFYTDAFSIKGLEFDYVFVLHFDRLHYPNQTRINELNERAKGNTTSQTYDDDYDTILNDEKKILYVAMTRAKEQLYMLLSRPKPIQVSPFLRQFSSQSYESYGLKKKTYSK
ncbi:UvrD-helicase domain-containing protein [Alkalihalophilus marmarensis]|uniref:UvrD-helicase domain-containing protein n=1 Tax=Alkalihalophilus marmarensis TaxID=521377 RepID=UPI002DC02A26|nr:UvrD-helicase domain-containing protein [Alkalihalophilus marmarensis]MEC2072485.1 3'-5' exonuclease [Alkalihalophilus marmarensis]